MTKLRVGRAVACAACVLWVLASGEVQAQDEERPPPIEDERPPPVESASAPRTGLFFRVTAGAEHATNVTVPPAGSEVDSEITMSGVGFAMALDFGYAPMGAYAIHLRGVLTATDSPTVELDGASGEARETSLRTGAFGLAATYYPLPFIYATAVFGLCQVTLDVTVDDYLLTANTDFGPWLNADLGLELPVSNLRFGVGLRVQYAAMPGGDGSDVEHTSVGGFASLTFIEP